MGEQFTKDLCSRLEHQNFNDLLVDPEYIKGLKQNPPELSKASLDNLTEIVKVCKRKISEPKEGLLAPLRKLQQKDFELSPGVITALHDFLRLDSTKFVTPADHYAYTCYQESIQLVGEIIWRFLATLYYDLTSTLDSTNQRTSTTTDGGVAFIARVIKSSGCPDGLETIQSKVKNWVVIGRRFRGFANAIHHPKVSTGVFIYLPKCASNNFIGKRLPMTGPTFDAAIEIFRENDVHGKSEREGVDHLAEKIMQTLSRPFSGSVSLTVQVGQRIVPVTAMALPQRVHALPGRSQSSTNPSQPPADLLQSLTSSPSPGSRLQTSGPGSPRPSSYFSAVYTPPSLEISSQSSETGRWSGDTDMHGAEQLILDHDQAEPNRSPNEVEDTEVMDIDNTPSYRTLDNFGGSNPKAIPRLAANGFTASIPTAAFLDNEPVSLWKCNDFQGFTPDCSRELRSPSPPQALLVAEELFHNVKVYFRDSCQKMIFDDDGTLLDPNGAELRNDLSNDFDSYCFTATMFKERGLYFEFRRAIVKATALVGQILRAEHPRTLACILEVFIHLIQMGQPEVTHYLRQFIKEMSARVTRKGHPWGQIWRLLGELDSGSLVQAMIHIWKCTTDTFESELGPFSRLAVSVRLDYIKRVYRFACNLEEEERLLRGLLAHLKGGGGIPRVPTPRVMLNLAHNLNGQGLHDKAEKMAQEVFSLLEKHEIYAKRNVERIECMKIISLSQYNQVKTVEAEQTMRKAIRMIVDQWGTQHSWVLEFKNVLEGWLRDWGQEEDANVLRGEIEELMGRDELEGVL